MGGHQFRQALNNKIGLFFYSKTGAQALPFQGGFLCIRSPVRRTPPQGSGGNPPPDDCSGSYDLDFDAWVLSGADPALQVPGTPVWGQFWSRDPASPSTTGLTDAIRFSMCP